MPIADAPSPASIAHVTSTRSTGRTPISAEARGLARDFCRRVRHEACQLNELAISAALQRRMARYPDRRPRESMVRDLERNWRTAEPQDFRLQFQCSWRGKDTFIRERAVTVLDGFRLPHWDIDDYGVEVVDTWFHVNRGRADAGIQSRMWVGSHALARWYQRRGTRADARLLNDLAAGAAIDLSDRASFPDLDSVRIPVDATAGWRGAIMRPPEAIHDELVFYAKTFI